ncbi:hypothetical protein GCM10009584_09850 [Ornithinimicrobium humiphilum]|uniref:Uncharacterized protein n=1 Tax=Ornithinimicrobium humiphilum TaxID=125288 RepID=A0A543KR22_9MICO|nr:hypothetical protein [Ornithinimicrobium humiphilum]TQM97494.1 hypothetical protein FB476_2407 [Ornithinimicrobium humiphilum]
MEMTIVNLVGPSVDGARGLPTTSDGARRTRVFRDVAGGVPVFGGFGRPTGTDASPTPDPILDVTFAPTS